MMEGDYRYQGIPSPENNEGVTAKGAWEAAKTTVGGIATGAGIVAYETGNLGKKGITTAGEKLHTKAGEIVSFTNRKIGEAVIKTDEVLEGTLPAILKKEHDQDDI
jgi:hypothetical protein